MNDILRKIYENKKIELEFSKKKCSYSSLEKLIDNDKNRQFKELIFNANKHKKNNIIAEIKQKSPSAGIILDDYVPEVIATEYEKSGIGAISILTENKFFGGDLEHLSLISKKTKIPLLRKDFIIDPYQILESKVYKADAILIILSILSDNEAIELINIAKKYGLDCLVETHTEEEVKRAISIGYPIIGINNRNLKNLSIDTSNTIKLINKIPKNEFSVVAESGIKTRDDINIYNEMGIFNFLIGESILKSSNINKKIKELLN